MRKSIWEWLEIEPTKDIDKIKAAYAEMSKKYHPTECPDEFRMLRDSYKMAVQYASIPGKDTAKDTEVYHIMERSTAGKENTENNSDISAENSDESNEDAQGNIYDFSKVANRLILSDRQKRMLAMVADMMAMATLDVAKYANEKVVSTITDKWSKSPYQEELSSVFVEAVLEILTGGVSLSKESYDIFERALFRNQTESYEQLHARFLALKNETEGVQIRQGKNGKFTTVDLTKAFLRTSNKNMTRIVIGHFFNDKVMSIPFFYNLFYKKLGIVTSPKLTVYLIKDYMLFVDKQVRYYHCADISFDIDNKSDALTIFDEEGKEILKVRPCPHTYQQLLAHLLNNGADNLSTKPLDETGSIGKVDSLKKLLLDIKPFIYTIVIYLGIMFISAMAFIRIVNLNETINNEVLHVAMNAIELLVGLFTLFWAISALVVGTMVFSMEFSYGDALKVADKKQLQEDIKDGNASYVLGNNLFIFSKYIIGLVKNDYVLVPINNIAYVEAVYNEEFSGYSQLKIVLKGGQHRFFYIYSDRALDAVVELLEKKVQEYESYRERVVNGE
ncbi:hypothetical protein [Butyrivibrio sp. VCB2006]|uniref:hypothetical protein n=1 Tax=Butyrivibrio sp. VCB2006 TaxID=1280679 RepID=UPI0004090CFC|nr:hypothetical protein [Butyrivibrio sp. VCB2006]